VTGAGKTDTVQVEISANARRALTPFYGIKKIYFSCSGYVFPLDRGLLMGDRGLLMGDPVI
jgi:hypothetical protein